MLDCGSSICCPASNTDVDLPRNVVSAHASGMACPFVMPFGCPVLSTGCVGIKSCSAGKSNNSVVRESVLELDVLSACPPRLLTHCIVNISMTRVSLTPPTVFVCQGSLQVQ